jgi:hypothetical protein
MTEPHAHDPHVTDHLPDAHAQASHAVPAVLAEAELQQLHAADRFAARVIVCLMAGIFLTGLTLYSIIFLVVVS